VGDRVLQQVGQLIQSELREGEIAACVGGKEFALLLPHTSAINVAKGTEGIRKTIGQTAFETDDGNKLTVTVTAEIGDPNKQKPLNNLASYAGIVPRVKQTGGLDGRTYTGPVAKRCNRILKDCVV
jgi:diguanylate cyclase (GGDEF)-like protein